MRKIIWSIVLLSSYWTSYCQESTISTNIYENNGKLGIGITTPENDFTIEGNYSSGLERNLIKLNNLDDGSMSYTGIILKTGDSNLMSVIQDYGTNYTASVPYDFGGFLNLSNNSSGLMLHANSEHGIIKFFTGHDDVAGAGIERLRINSDGKIGIGTKSPEFLLHLKSNSDNYSTIPRQFIQLENENDGDHSNVAIALSSGTDANMGSASFGVTAKSYSINSFGGYAYMYNTNNGILLRANSENSKIRFFTGGDGEDFERMHIDSIGNVGIGTSKPNARVEIADGDIYISDIEKGIIMKSPDGQCWRGTLDNNGSLTFTQVDCPSVSTTTKATESVILSKKEISIYPNPTKDIIIVDVKSLDSKDLKYCIYDINGNLMRSNILESNYNQIDISFLSNGYYLLNINNINGNQLISEKIIKQ